MALTGTGANLAFKDNGAGNGKLTFDWSLDGNPKFNDDQAELVMSLLYESPWFGDALGKRRSKLATIATNDASTPGRLQQYALDALQPGIDDGRLANVSATVAAAGSGYSLTVQYTTRSGKKATQTVALSV